MKAYLDATVLIALGTIGELDRVAVFDAEPTVVPAVRDEVTTEPARTALDRAIATGTMTAQARPSETALREAAAILDDPDQSADVELVAAVLDDLEADAPVAVVSDDRRVRTIARGLGATVTGTIGVVVRAVEDGLDPEAGETLIRRLDQHGLHMTASLRERAVELIDEAAE